MKTEHFRIYETGSEDEEGEAEPQAQKRRNISFPPANDQDAKEAQEINDTDKGSGSQVQKGNRKKALNQKSKPEWPRKHA